MGPVLNWLCSQLRGPPKQPDDLDGSLLKLYQTNREFPLQNWTYMESDRLRGEARLHELQDLLAADGDIENTYREIIRVQTKLADIAEQQDKHKRVVDYMIALQTWRG